MKYILFQLFLLNILYFVLVRIAIPSIWPPNNLIRKEMALYHNSNNSFKTQYYFFEMIIKVWFLQPGFNGRGAKIPDGNSPVCSLLDHRLVLATAEPARANVLSVGRDLLRQNPRRLHLDAVPSVRATRGSHFHLRSSFASDFVEHSSLINT